MLNTGKRRMKVLLLGVSAAIIIVGAAIIAGCYPGSVESVEELDLVVTLFDKDANFSTYKTYAMPDSVLQICEVEVAEQDASCPKDLTRTYDAQILSQAKQNLANLGFTPVTNPQQADVLVVVSANATDNYGYAYYPWYWDWWYGGYPGWGWYYPGYYPGYAVPYQYTTGTLFINMFDPDKADAANKRLGAVWVAAINGLLGEGGNPQVRLTTDINQAFAQSTYLDWPR